jgi:hypothetical protein
MAKGKKRISHSKPRFLGLTKQEIVNYALSFQIVNSNISIPVSVLSFFIPGGRRILFEQSKDGNFMSVSLLIGDGYERLTLPSDDILIKNDIWELPEKLLKSVNSILMKQLFSAYSDIETASSFFEWFCDIFISFSNPTHYPLQIQILNSLIWLWSSEMFERTRFLVFSDFTLLLPKFLDYFIGNIVSCMYFLMVIQRLKFPLNEYNTILKIIIGKSRFPNLKEKDENDTSKEGFFSEKESESLLCSNSSKGTNSSYNQTFKNFEDFDDELEYSDNNKVEFKNDEDIENMSVVINVERAPIENSVFEFGLKSSDTLSKEYNDLFHLISKKLFFSFYHIYMKILNIIKTLKNHLSGYSFENSGCVIQPEPDYISFHISKPFEGNLNNSFVINSKLTNEILLLQDKKSQNIYFNVSGLSYFLNNQDSQKSLNFGGEWIPSHNSLYSLPITSSILFIHNALYSSILNSNRQNAQICGPLIICDEDNFNVTKIIIKDIFHFFNHNLHVFYCTASTEISLLIRFLFSQLVDSHWIILMNLENLQNDVCSSLLDICFLLFFFKKNNLNFICSE